MSRIVRGYQGGLSASVLATVAASAAALIAGWPSPLEATAQWIMQWMPPGLANAILSLTGPYARPAALLGALAIAMLAGGVAGALATAFGEGTVSRATGLAVAAAFLALVFLRFFPPSEPEPDVWLIGAMVVALALLPKRSPVEGRREALARGAAILGGAAALLALFAAEPMVRAISARQLFRYAEPRGWHIEGLTDLVTRSDRFYRMDAVLQYPTADPPGWNLRIDGDVGKPMTLDYESLVRGPQQHRYITMECVDNPVGGPMIGNALWTGVPVVQLLQEAGARGNLIAFHSVDGYVETAPHALLEESGALIAYGMNGHTLPREHGYPARLILPGVYGFKSVKWLRRIEVTNGADGGSWKAHGWTVEGRIHTMARIDVARRQAGEIVAAGIAFAGTRGINAVEVRVNGGPWRRATLGPALSHATWVQWGIRLRQNRREDSTQRHSENGTVRIEARAVDGEGNVQIGRAHGAYPDGSTGWHSVTV